ncbi:hypothetical protein [Vibrio gallaecicus]|nr:hypothetical protein [Vibrio gallaecicus]MDN3613660.1 hypothetical protein [Vibrio gallaecicus]
MLHIFKYNPVPYLLTNSTKSSFPLITFYSLNLFDNLIILAKTHPIPSIN